MIENILLALVSLKANKMRALLTMLGIVIGISSVITIVTLGDSLNSAISGSMQDLGANNVIVYLQRRDNGNIARRISTISESDLMTEEMILALQEAYPQDILAVSRQQSVGAGKVSEGRKSSQVTLVGVSPDYYRVNTVKMLTGRTTNANDAVGNRKVAVVSDYLVNRMFGLTDPLGQTITVVAGTHTGIYTIVGVYEYSPNAFSFSTSSEQTTNVYIPLSLAQKIAGSPGGYMSFSFSTPAGYDSQAFASVASAFMNRYYTRNTVWNVSVMSMETMLSTFMDLLNTIQIVIAAIAAISLLVGGIGVMNIMLVSITERTREIGTRKAIGATNNAIRMQFIVEAMIICLIGGVIGITLGTLLGSAAVSVLGSLAASNMNITPKPSLVTIAVATGFSLAIGVFFGYYPANKAAKMDPIEALRYE